MKGVKYSDLVSVLNFMYHGEVNVAQEELNSFLAVAEDLKVKGLTQNNSSGSSSKPTPPPSAPRPNPVQAAPPPKRPRPLEPSPRPPPPRPQASYRHQEDDDIQEVMSPMVKSEPVQHSQPTHEQQVVDNSGAMAAYGEEEAYEQYEGYEGDYDPGAMVHDPNMSGADGNKGRLLL